MQKVMMSDFELSAKFLRRLNSGRGCNSEHMLIAQRALHNALEYDLTERQRLVVGMYYFDRRKLQEIADILGVDRSTVCRTLHRGKARLEKCMQIYFDYISYPLHDLSA